MLSIHTQSTYTLKNTITVTVKFEGLNYELKTYPYEYRSLMALLYDKLYIDEEFGECKGMGRCGTCLIRLTHYLICPTLTDRNQEATLTKMKVTGSDYHLSCQIEVDENLHGAELEIVDL